VSVVLLIRPEAVAGQSNKTAPTVPFAAAW
jgi:hypothetical protein